jgi:hypothetical protein
MLLKLGTARRLATWAAAGRSKRSLEAVQAEREAAEMIAQHGALAYSIVRRWARLERETGRLDPFRPKGHWERVRRWIKRIETADRQASRPHRDGNSAKPLGV